MSLVKTWYTLAEAEAKFGLSEQTLLKWVDEGLVRSETEKKNVVRVNGDDVELKLREMM